jgi:DNA replication protein DnaC
MELKEKSLLDLEAKDWAEMDLRYRLWNYIRLVEYLYQIENKKPFKYEINDPSAISKIIDLLEKGKEGILLCGEIGSGKTFLMKMIQKVMTPNERYRIINTIDLVTDFKTNGEDALGKYVDKKIFFDDLGFEQKGVHFGDKVDCIDYIANKRFIEFTDNGVLTFFATNLKKEQIKERYDSRIYDRILGMCVPVVLKGQSKRSYRYSDITLPQIFPIMYGQPKPNPPQFTIGPVESKPLGQQVKESMDILIGVPDHENQNTVKIGGIIK